jgi:hypothetical protein
MHLVAGWSGAGYTIRPAVPPSALALGGHRRSGSIRDRRRTDHYLVGVSADLNRIGCDTHRARGGEHDALARREDGFDAYRRAGRFGQFGLTRR